MRSFPPAFAAAILLVVAAISAGAALAQPVIHVDPEVLDFGRMSQMETRSGDVVITNRGDTPLKIDEVKPTCGCTVAKPDRDVLSPGESTMLHIEFNSKTFQGEESKIVKIYTNDPRRPEFHLYVDAYVTTPLMTEPKTPRLGFSPMRQGETAQRIYEFTAMEQPELHIQLERHDPDLFDIKVINNYEGNPQRAVLEVNVPPTMPLGDNRDLIRVATNVPDVPTKDIELRVQTVLDLKIFPDRVNFRFVEPGQPMRKDLRISPFERDLKFEVQKAEIDIPGLKAKVDETIPDKEFFVRLEGKALAKDDPRVVGAEGRLTGTLRIHTSVKGQPVIEVPVSYMIRL